MPNGPRASPRLSRIESSAGKRTTSASKKLLKMVVTKSSTAMPKTETFVETPDTSVNNTFFGIKKARAQFNEFKETPRTVLAENLADHSQKVVVADDLFTAAKAATAARKEKLGRKIDKRKQLAIVNGE